MNKSFTEQYRDVLKDILDNGAYHKTGHREATRRIRGFQMTVTETSNGLMPMNTLRKNPIGGTLREFEQFRDQKLNVKDFGKSGFNTYGLWDKQVDDAVKADQDTLVVPYWWEFDAQFKNIIKKYNKDSYSRKLIFCNMPHFMDSCLTACWSQLTFQKKSCGRVDVIMTLNSTDAFIGMPADTATAALILILFCKTVDAKPGNVVLKFNDLHIYERHLAEAERMIKEDIKHQSPSYWLRPGTDLFNYSALNKDLTYMYKYNSGEYDTSFSQPEDL